MKGYVSGVGDRRVIFQVAALCCYVDVATESLMMIILLVLTASAVDVSPTLTLV